MTGFVDIHSHVIWGVDDGARTREESLAMLERAAASGTRVLFATPHVVASYGYPFSRERRELARARLDELREAAPAGLELRAGWEVTPSADRLRPWDDLARFRLEGTRHVLLDGPQNGPWSGDPYLFRLIRRVLASGLVPVVAHPERRASPRFPEADPDLAARLRDAGALVQVDASALAGGDGAAAQADARRLLAAGVCDLIGSDAHGPRAGSWPDLAAAHAETAALADAATAARLAACARELASSG